MEIIKENYSKDSLGIDGFDFDIIKEFEEDGYKGYHVTYFKDNKKVATIEIYEDEAAPITVLSIHAPNSTLFNAYETFKDFATDLTNKISSKEIIEEDLDDDMTTFIDSYITESKFDMLENNKKSKFDADFTNEGKADIQYNIGSDKNVAVDSKEYKLLEDLANMLTAQSPNNWTYKVKEIYEDFGAGMMWKNIVCYGDGNSWQVLNTKQWIDLMNTGDIEAAFDSILADKYFQDVFKPDDIGSLFKYMDSELDD